MHRREWMISNLAGEKDMDEEFIVEFILGLLFIIVPMYVKKQGDYKNFTVQYLKDIHPERLKSAYGRYINEKYREIRDNEYKERGKIEAEIERKIIIESRKYENGENPEKVVEYEDEK